MRRRTSAQKDDDRLERIARKKMEPVGQLGYFEVFPYQESYYGL
jgi:hypothetical protein